MWLLNHCHMTLNEFSLTFSPSDVLKMESQPKTVSAAGDLSLVVCINEVTNLLPLTIFTLLHCCCSYVSFFPLRLSW